jgi:hypothetical protein
VKYAVPRVLFLAAAAGGRPALETLRHALLAAGPWKTIAGAAKITVRYLAHHTGVPALLVAAILVAVGYRILKRSARFALEVTAVALVLVAATELGWIRW